jgi:hypothetical protein
MPALARISSSAKVPFLLGSKGTEGAYPEPGLMVEAIELLGVSGGSTLICSS